MASVLGTDPDRGSRVTNSLKALETAWDGYRFRSRTEARWAVALDAADIPFEYEAQGYALPTGWYLPDFWLPSRNVWLEIKGSDPTEREVSLARELAAETKHGVLIAVGTPNPDDDSLLMFVPDTEQELETRFQMPASAYAKARAERFDGKPTHTVATSNRLKAARGW